LARSAVSLAISLADWASSRSDKVFICFTRSPE
jgi:hypothetical protein